MMEFTKEMMIGVPHIDAQHKELVEFLNKSIKLCSVTPGKEDVDEALNFLGAYVVTHFADEEKLQIESGFPNYQQHKKLHDDFVKTYSVLKMTYNSGEISLVKLSQILVRKVASWVINHVKQEDAEFGKHYSKYKEAQELL